MPINFLVELLAARHRLELEQGIPNSAAKPTDHAEFMRELIGDLELLGVLGTNIDYTCDEYHQP